MYISRQTIVNENNCRRLRFYIFVLFCFVSMHSHMFWMRRLRILWFFAILTVSESLNISSLLHNLSLCLNVKATKKAEKTHSHFNEIRLWYFKFDRKWIESENNNVNFYFIWVRKTENSQLTYFIVWRAEKNLQTNFSVSLNICIIYCTLLCFCVQLLLLDPCVLCIYIKLAS